MVVPDGWIYFPPPLILNVAIVGAVLVAAVGTGGDTPERVKAWLEGAGIKMKDVAQPIRVALTGRKASPGLFDVMVVLGRETTLTRLGRAIDVARNA